MRALVPALSLALLAGCRTAPPAPDTPPGPTLASAPASAPAPSAAVATQAPAAPPPAKEAPPTPLTPDEVAAAEGLVENNCLGCHTVELLQQQRLTAKQWDATIKKMQGWGAPLEPENVELLVRYATGKYGKDAGPFELRRVNAAEAAAALAPQPDGPLAKGSAQQGAKVYQEQCAACHGADGKGAALGVNLVDRPSLYRAQEFATLVRQGRNRMPQFAATDGQLASLLAYLRTLER